MKDKEKKRRSQPIHWLIRGYEGTDKIYERKVGAGVFGGRQIEMLLMALAAKHLTFDEILGACAKKNTKLHNKLLAVHRESSFHMLSCGQDQFFTAEIAERQELRASLER
jgi:hypothetical protein